MNLRYTIILTLILSGITVAARGQGPFGYNSVAEKQFAAAVQLFKGDRYAEASNVFDALAKLQPVHQRTTASLLMAAKSYFELREYARAKSLLIDLLDRFPESAYSDEASYVLGLIFAVQSKYQEAFGDLVRVIESANDTLLVGRALSVIDSTIAGHLSLQAIQSTMTDTHKRDLEDLLTLRLAERFLTVRNFSQAQQLVDKALMRSPAGRFSYRLQSLRQRLIHREREKVKVGVMLPLNTASSASTAKTFSDEILDGITFAANTFNDQLPPFADVSLDVRNTERDAAESRKAIRSLAADKNVVAVIGPLFSDIVLSCAPTANGEHLPMISPTANAVGLTADGPYVFQLNPDIAKRGMAMARYAVQVLGLNVLAVLAPREPTVNELVQSFTTESHRLGAKIIDVETYAMDSTELRDQFMNLRKAALMGEPQVSFAGKISRFDLGRIVGAGADSRLVDSLVQFGKEIGVIKLFGPNGRRIADSLHLKVIVPDVPIDNVDRSLTAIEGLFVPLADVEEIGIVASQIAYFNIKTQLLGNDEWYNLPYLEAQRRYVDGVVICSDSYIDNGDSSYRAFERSFSNRMNSMPTKYTLFGYDAMNLLLSFFNSGVQTREQLARDLGTTRGFRAFHTTITLDRQRVNAVMHILQYRKDEIKKIGEITVE